MDSSYALSGYSNPKDIPEDELDMVGCCLPGNFMNCPQMNGSTKPAELCPRYMSERASRKWDHYTQDYYASLTPSQQIMFLHDTARVKYCHNDSKDPNVQCGIRCSRFDPTSPDAPYVCENVGSTSWRGTPQGPWYMMDTGDYNPIQLDPMYIGRCMQTCNLYSETPDSLTNQDTVLNLCLQRGACNDVLVDLASNMIQNKIPIKNQAFAQWIQLNTQVPPSSGRREEPPLPPVPLIPKKQLSPPVLKPLSPLMLAMNAPIVSPISSLEGLSGSSWFWIVFVVAILLLIALILWNRYAATCTECRM
jgi:hypothetical protein